MLSAASILAPSVRSAEIAFKRSIEKAGHVETGELRNSVAARVDLSQLPAIELEFRSYGVVLSDGLPGSRVPYQRGSGASSNEMISAVRAWARRRGFSNPDQAAFAIAEKWKKEGRKGSGWIDDAVRDTREGVQKAFELELQRQMEAELEKMDYE